MNSENWLKVEELLNVALEIEPEARRKFLDEIGADDIRREVESLLNCDAKTDGFLASPAIAFSNDFFEDVESPDAFLNQEIGNYKIVGELGRGGMGAVYLAERSDGKFSQKVAVKLLKRELNTADIRRRFRHERQILAALAHPNIARLLDAGTTDDGLPFLVMEYVEGLPINEFCDAHNLDLNERLEIFRNVCDAVAFAHRNLIVHRDLKPSNILVTTDAIPKLLDFGISKLLTPEFESESEHTVTKLGAMTPEYASPEQLRGESVTTATDVYSLGVILYELLTAHRPFGLKKNRSPQEIIQAVCNTEPTPPSAALSAERGTPSAELKDAFQTNGKQSTNQNRQKTAPRSAFRIPRSGDLDNIVLKALKKEPSRRYSSVEQFSEDIRRHLENLPVLARPDTPLYRAAKFVSRNRVGVFAGLLIFLSLVGGVVATVWQMRRAEANQIKAEKRFNDVRRLSNALLFELSPKIERLPGATEAREILVNRALEYLDSLAREAEGDLTLQSELAAAYEKIGDLQGNPVNPSFIDTESAIKSYEKAQAIRLRLSKKNPSDFEQRRSLAENYRLLGRVYGQANDFLTETKNLDTALRIYEELVAENPSSGELKFALAQTDYNLGRNRSSVKKYAEAFQYFERAVAALERLHAENPNRTDVIKLLGDCRTDFGNALSWDGKQAEAEAHGTQAIELLEQAVTANPNDVNLRGGLWFAYWLTSSTYEEVNDPLSHELAVKALRVIEEIVRQDEANIRAKKQLSLSFSRIGQTLINTGKIEEAILNLEKSRWILQEITESRTKNYSLKNDLTVILMRLGEAKFKQKKFPDALLDFEQAADVHLEILRNHPDDTRTERNLAQTYESIAETHQQIGGEKDAAARENYQKVLDILLRLEARNTLGEFDGRFLEKTKITLQKF
jgi:eukaryotic-like serine/threonine-protein kinase